MTEYAYGHCEENRKPGGCQLHNLHCGYPDCDRRALTGAQPATAAPSGESVEALARRMAWRHKKSTDPHHSDTYTFNRATLLDFAATLLTPRALAAIAASAAQPADSAMRVLIELIAIQDLKKKHAIAAYMAKTQVGQLQRDGLAECDRLSTELARIEKPAWDRARALTAASKERSK